MQNSFFSSDAISDKSADQQVCELNISPS